MGDAAWFRPVLPILSALRQVVLTGWAMSVADLPVVVRLPDLAHIEVHGSLCHKGTIVDCGCEDAMSLPVGCHTLFLPFLAPTTHRRYVVSHSSSS
jgi:hypothetical protein